MAIGSFEETMAGRLAAVERRLDDLIAQDRPNSGTTGYFDYIVPVSSSTVYVSGVALEIGAHATANGFSYIDLHGANPSYPDFADRWIRGSAGANAQAGFVHRGTGTFYFQNQEDAGYEWYVSNVVKMRLASDGTHVRLDVIDVFYTSLGNLNIRPLNAGGSGGQVTLLGSTGYNHMYIDNESNTMRFVDATNGLMAQWSSDGQDFYAGGARRWRMTSGGNLGAGTGTPTYRLQLDIDSAGKPGTSTWAVVSDPGTKEDVQAFEHGLDALQAFPRPVTFYYNGCYGSPKDGVEYVGYMADEVQRVAPKMVITTDYVDAETGERTPVRYTNISALTPMMHNAILDLAARVLTLEQRTAAT